MIFITGLETLGSSYSRILLISVPWLLIESTSLTHSLAPVCTTELGQVAKLKDLFEQYNTKVIGLSVDNIEDHLRTEL